MFNNFQKMYNAGLLNGEETIKTLNKIDNLITNSILHAEKRCHKIKSGQVLYYPEISHIYKEFNVWNNVIWKNFGCNIPSKYIKRIARKLEYPIHAISFCKIVRRNEHQPHKKSSNKMPNNLEYNSFKNQHLSKLCVEMKQPAMQS